MKLFFRRFGSVLWVALGSENLVAKSNQGEVQDFQPKSFSLVSKYFDMLSCLSTNILRPITDTLPAPFAEIQTSQFGISLSIIRFPNTIYLFPYVHEQISTWHLCVFSP